MSNGQKFARAGVTEEAIARRAYEIWESRGCPDGTGDEDWQTAQDQLVAEQSHQPRGPLLRLFQRLTGRAATF